MEPIKFDRKKVKRVMYFLFNFNMAYFYTFIAGVLVSFAVNLFTTVLLTEDLPVSSYRVYRATLFLFISSIGAFVVSAVLEGARSEWESVGSPMDQNMKSNLIMQKRRIYLLLFFFAMIFIGVYFSFSYF